MRDRRLHIKRPIKELYMLHSSGMLLFLAFSGGYCCSWGSFWIRYNIASPPYPQLAQQSDEQRQKQRNENWHVHSISVAEKKNKQDTRVSNRQEAASRPSANQLLLAWKIERGQQRRVGEGLL